MDEDAYLGRLVEVLINCHGPNAENVARKRSGRCRRSEQLEWVERWDKVANISPAAIQRDESVRACCIFFELNQAPVSQNRSSQIWLAPSRIIA